MSEAEVRRTLRDDLTTESREREATILAGLSGLLVKTGFALFVGRRLPAVRRCSALHGDKCSHKSPPKVLAESADDAGAPLAPEGGVDCVSRAGQYNDGQIPGRAEREGPVR
jgi:hypothetical protein